MATSDSFGLRPSEVAFLCEMELVTIVPRQRLEALDLLGCNIPALRPPYRADIPLWLALLLKRQRRCNIVPPAWLSPDALQATLDFEIENESEFSPAQPFDITPSDPSEPAFGPPLVPSSTASVTSTQLPYHWLEMGELLLNAAGDDFSDAADVVRRLLRDLREVRGAKLRVNARALGTGRAMDLTGVGAMEVSEERPFICVVADEVRKLGALVEHTRREVEAEDEEDGRGGEDDLAGDVNGDSMETS